MLGWYDVEKSSCGNIRRFNSHHIALLRSSLMALLLKIIIGGEDVNININTSINTNMMLMLMLVLMLMLIL